MVSDIFIWLGILCALLFIVVFVWDITRDVCHHDWGKWDYIEDSRVFVHKRQCSKCGLYDIKQVLKLWS